MASLLFAVALTTFIGIANIPAIRSEIRPPKVIHAVLIHGGEYICSAVLITDKHALVAAGYVQVLGESPQRLFINVKGMELPVRVVRIKLYQHYNPVMFYGDIAVLTMRYALKKIFVPPNMAHLSEEKIQPNKVAILCGWKYAKHCSIPPKETRKVFKTENVNLGQWLFTLDSHLSASIEHRGAPVLTISEKVIGIAVSSNITGPLLFTRVNFFFEYFIKLAVGKYSRDEMTGQNEEVSESENRENGSNNECKNALMTQPLLEKEKKAKLKKNSPWFKLANLRGRFHIK